MTVSDAEALAELLPCPFCGSNKIDPEGWASTECAGPACDDCAATADTVETWNTRTPIPVAVSRKALNILGDEVVSRINEWDDRTSPDDFPEALLITSSELHRELMRFADAILTLSLPAVAVSREEVAHDKLTLFLSILQAAGGETSGNDDKWNWINYFCDDAEPLDTFNQASKRKLTRVTHDSDADNSVVYLTEEGKQFLSLSLQLHDRAAPKVSIKPMQLSENRTDYFVSIRAGDREVTPHVFREEYKAAYHVALYDWLLNGSGEEPDVVEFGPNDWPARVHDRAAGVGK